MFNRLSVGQKIVGLSVSLLALMLAVACYSWWQSRQARDAAADVSTTLDPVGREVLAIENHVLEQEVLLERAVRHQTAEDWSPKEADAEMAQFTKLEGDVEKRVQTAEGLAASGLQQVVLKDDAIMLAALAPELDALRREHVAYATAAHDVYDAAVKEAGHRNATPDPRLDPDGVRPLDERLSSDEERVESALDRLSTDIDADSDSESHQLVLTESRAYRLSIESLLLAVAAFVTGSSLSTLATRRMVRPVRALIRGTEQVAAGNLDVVIDSDLGDEIGQLSRAFQHMIGELRAKERIKSTFGKYVDPRVVERLLLTDGQGGMGSVGAGEKCVMTVFFSDLEGFTDVSESLTATNLVNLINNYLTLASEPIVGELGVIDKYVGDAVIAFWGPPFYDEPDHARRACLAALAQQDQLMELRRLLPDILGVRRNLPTLRVRVGLSTGELIVGSIGSHVSKSFTVMGDTVNIASRLEGANKAYGTRILIDAATREMVRDSMETREIDTVIVVGKSEPVRIYELLGESGRVGEEVRAARDAFEAGLAAYRQRDWAAALEQFQQALALAPDDKATQVFLTRVQEFRAHPPAADWDAVWRLAEK